jgi:hypothetical protein
MIDDAERIFNYLPIEYKTKIESDYVAFLWDTFSVNYDKEKFQFAYIAYHMLFMCFVYFQLTKIYINIPDDIRRILIFTREAQTAVDTYEQRMKEAIAKKGTIPHFDPFSLSRENESTIVGLFVSIGCKRDTIKRLKKLVKDRNEVAHSNGAINFSVQSSLDEKIEEILDCIDEIHQNSRSTIEDCTERFLIDSSNPDENEYSITEDQVREIFIRNKYLSPLDLLQASKFPIEELKERDGYSYIKELALSISVLNNLPEYENVVRMARGAVEDSMESAVWDEQNHKITLNMIPGEDIPMTFTTFVKLEECLIEVAKLVFWSNSRHEPEEEFPLSFDAGTIVNDVLSNYEDQLASLFLEGADDWKNDQGHEYPLMGEMI